MSHPDEEYMGEQYGIGFEAGVAHGQQKEKARIKAALLKASDEGKGPEHNLYYALMDVVEKL